MNSVSEPPLISHKPEKPVTFADVAMRIANDGPMYATIALVGILAVNGKATASETVIASLGALLARSWPRAVQVMGKAGAHMLIVGAAVTGFAVVHACTPATVTPAAYGAELAACTNVSQTLHESIECENKVRNRYGRPLRDAGVE
jgi:hypothetical protein